MSLAGPANVFADAFELTWQEFHANGTANVFDGGPPMTGSVDVIGPEHTGGFLTVTDFTPGGSMGAIASVITDSETSSLPDRLLFDVLFSAAYFPSFFPGGDAPGGRAEGEMLSIIEFEMPVPSLEMRHSFSNEEMSGWFSGSTLVTVENVTTSQALLVLDSPTQAPVYTDVFGEVGDVIRITSSMGGNGQIPPNFIYGGQYRSRVVVQFTIPEPATLWLYVAVAPWFVRKRRVDYRDAPTGDA